MKSLDHDDWDEPTYQSWFNNYSANEWFEMSAEAADRNWLKPGDRSLLYTMGKYASRNQFPNFKQLKYAKYVIDQFESIKQGQARMEKEQQRAKRKEKLTQSEIRHLSVRMAWHDNKWDGCICNDPEKNDYCIGEHSLLSRRLRERRKLDIEIPHHLESPDIKKLSGYQPPCFWSINAFGSENLEIEHDNPAASDLKRIPEQLPSYSVFTWPFRLSFNKDRDSIDRDGKYPANLEARIDRFLNRINEHQSIVFLYSNYDNPISGEDQQYLILGCAPLKEKGQTHSFKIPDDRYEQLTRYLPNKNFPRINWALRFSLDLPEHGVILPYHEYLADAEKSKHDDLLSEMKVVIDEPELTQCFKYVAMDIDDDQTIYLLTKIKRSLHIIEYQRRVEYDVESALDNIERMLKQCWQKRGLFPGFNRLVSILLDRDEIEDVRLHGIIEQLRNDYGEEHYKKLIKIFQNLDTIDESLAYYEDELLELADELHSREISGEDFIKLAMLNLTNRQFERIWKEEITESDVSLKDICENPYCLFEEYNKEYRFEVDPITGDQIDGPIELFKIDIAFFPDSRYLKRVREIQNYHPADKRRIRALIISYLQQLEGKGHCFDNAENIREHLENYPLFYKSEYNLPKDLLKQIDEEFKIHLEKKLVIKSDKDRLYYYLKEVWAAERFIDDTVSFILSLSDIHGRISFDSESYIKNSIKKLSGDLKERFDQEGFIEERTKLYQNIFKKRLYVLAGAPGTGKSHELLNIIQTIKDSKQSYLLLAPTGKSVLRLTSDSLYKGIEAQTIDKFLYDLPDDVKDGTIEVENLIFDEMSMVDLLKFCSLLRVINFKSTRFKRIILVGDPHQLPPIGFGKVFVDTIRFLREDDVRKADNIISLQVNCRQKLDSNIIEFARVFSGENKNYEDIITKVVKGGQISDGLFVSYWRNRYELREQIENRFKSLFGTTKKEDLGILLNKLLGLNEDGEIKGENLVTSLKQLDYFQVITPYRTTYYGSLGLNNFIQAKFREKEKFSYHGDLALKQGDKVIQIQNLYDYDTVKKKRILLLSNGSIGLFNSNPKRRFLFAEIGQPLLAKDFDDENLELGYAITVHKAQGSGFEHVFFVLPEKMGLLSRELLYTALTRSRSNISIFTFKDQATSEETSIFHQIRNISHVDTRRTTLLGQPIWEYSYTPAKGVNVKSRVEYIIYKKLQEFKERYPGFHFDYEDVLKLENKDFNIHPDFKVQLPSGQIYYWEHLGWWGDRSYERTWDNRKELYKEKGLLDSLLTTDERKGIKDEKIEQIIRALIDGKLSSEVDDPRFSKYHCSLG